MRVYILRHGKADKDSPTGHDLDRALVERGVAQARFIADRFLAGTVPLEHRPVVVLASRASRAASTAGIIARALGLEVAYDDDLFPDQSVRQALRLLSLDEVPASGGPVLLVGHNPQLEGLVRALAGSVPFEHLRTGELAAFDVEDRAGKLAGALMGTVRLHSP